MTKAERWARRYTELEKRAKEIQTRADTEIKQLSTEWPRLNFKRGNFHPDRTFEVTTNGMLSATPATKDPMLLAPEEALQLAYWIIDTFEEGEA